MKTFCHYFFIVFPIVGMLIFFICQEAAERELMTQHLTKLFGQDKAVELVLQSNLYSLNLGISDSTLETTLSTSVYLNKMIKMDLDRIYLLMSLVDSKQA